MFCIWLQILSMPWVHDVCDQSPSPDSWYFQVLLQGIQKQLFPFMHPYEDLGGGSRFNCKLRCYSMEHICWLNAFKLNSMKKLCLNYFLSNPEAIRFSYKMSWYILNRALGPLAAKHRQTMPMAHRQIWQKIWGASPYMHSTFPSNMFMVCMAKTFNVGLIWP